MAATAQREVTPAGTTTIQPKWIAALVLIAAFAIAWFSLPVKDWLQALTVWIESLGLLGVIVFALVYVAVVVVLAPAEIMSIAAGVIFGAWGIPLVVVAAAFGASLAFLISRYLLRDRVKRLARKWRLFAAVDKAVGEESWKIVLLLRLNPFVPFGLQNYFFGVTKIAFLPYAVATSFGIIPGAAMYVYIGILGHAAAGEGGAGNVAFLAAGLVATAVTAFLVTRKARAKLKEAGAD